MTAADRKYILSLETAVFDLRCYLDEAISGQQLESEPIPDRPGYKMADEVYRNFSDRWHKQARITIHE